MAKSELPDAFQDALIQNVTDPVGEPAGTPQTQAPQTGEPSAPAADKIVVTEPSTTEPVSTEPTTGTPVKGEEPSTTEPVSTEPTTAEPASLEDWDSTPTQEPVADKPADAPKIDFKPISETIGKDIQSVDQLVAEIKTLKETQASDALAGIPDDLKKAVEIAKLDGDYLSYLNHNTVSDFYKSADPKQLFADKAAEFFTDSNGVLNKEKLLDYLDGVDEVDQIMRGTEIKNKLIQDAQANKAKYDQELKDSLREREYKVTEAMSKLNEVNGFKLGQPHKDVIKDGILSGKLIQEMFYDPNGNMDFVKVAKAYFNYKYGEKAISFLRQNVQNTTKREMLNKISNASVATSPPEPAGVTPQTKSAESVLAEQLASGDFLRNF